MLIRGQTTEERIAEIANGFGKGLQNFQQGQSQQRAQSLQDEASKRQQAVQAFEIEGKLSEQTGKMVPQGTGRAILSGADIDLGSILKAQPSTAKSENAAIKKQREDLKFQQEQDKFNREAEEDAKPFNQTKKFQEQEALFGLKAQNKKEATPKQNEFAAAGFSKRARQAEAELSSLPSDMGTGATDSFNDYIPSVMKGEKTKLFEQAKRNFISANLRKESGAAISDDEYANEERKYFAQPGDTTAVLAQKARSREQAMLNLEAEGTNALSRVGDATKAGYAPASSSGSFGIQNANAADVESIKKTPRADKIRFLTEG